MARDSDDAVPIESWDELAADIEAGEKPPERWRIGTEHEKFPFYQDDLAPVPYEADAKGRPGIRAVLEGMRDLDHWVPIEDGGRIIGLAEPDGAKGPGGAISLEPGGQFELSGAPLETIHQTCSEANQHLEHLRSVAEPMGIGFLGVGFDPLRRREDVPLMPKRRYEIMRGYMPRVGEHGLDMMLRTCTVQVNLDFASEADMVVKMRASIALQPIATALFANSPFREGAPTDAVSLRSRMWRDTDPARTGMIPFVFDEGFGYQAYVDYALDVPMYFVKRGDTYHDVSGASFRQFLESGLDALPGERPTHSDWTNHVSTIFPEVRLKRFLEMRGADGAPWRRICALPAFWVGLLYDEEALGEALELVSGWTAEQRQALRDAVPETGLKGVVEGIDVHATARRAVAIARDGLARRARMGWAGEDETSFLDPVLEVAESGITPAERLLERYHGAWGESVRPLYAEKAYY